jgi:hypothetical protein
MKFGQQLGARGALEPFLRPKDRVLDHQTSLSRNQNAGALNSLSPSRRRPKEDANQEPAAPTP